MQSDGEKNYTHCRNFDLTELADILCWIGLFLAGSDFEYAFLGEIQAPTY